MTAAVARRRERRRCGGIVWQPAGQLKTDSVDNLNFVRQMSSAVVNAASLLDAHAQRLGSKGFEPSKSDDLQYGPHTNCILTCNFDASDLQIRHCAPDRIRLRGLR